MYGFYHTNWGSTCTLYSATRQGTTRYLSPPNGWRYIARELDLALGRYGIRAAERKGSRLFNEQCRLRNEDSFASPGCRHGFAGAPKTVISETALISSPMERRAP